MASEIVVGVDFGTTYSGVSWAINGGNKNVRVINDWPNPLLALGTSDKVPSQLSYEKLEPHHWGYTVGPKEDSLCWFKLLLDPKNQVGRESEKVLDTVKLLQKLAKSAEDVAVDYLRMIWKYTTDDIQKIRGGDWSEVYTIRAVMTVPAIWSPGAMERTLNIAKKAGLPDDVRLVREPEAAALAVLKDRKEDGDTLRVGDCFVVCDAGGGTVDLISYKICGLDPLQIQECAVGDGKLCGSIYLDLAFEKYIRTIVGEDQWAGLRPRAKQKMMAEFEMSIKRCYAGDEQQYSVDLQDVEDNSKVDIDDETITLKPSILKTIFDHIIGQIKDLVDKQIDEVGERGSAVKAILLVGGFGTNRYMHQQLKDAHESCHIKVLQANNGWSSICRGATLWGLEHSEKYPSVSKTVTARIARYSYGIKCSRLYDETKGHSIQDRRRGMRGEWLADNQMHWMLEKGEKIEEGRLFNIQLAASVQVGLFSTGMEYFSDTLFFCADDEPPSRGEITVKELCKVSYGIKCSKLWRESSYKDPITGKKWRDATFNLLIQLDSAKLDFYVGYKGELVAYVNAKYKEEFS